MEGLGNWIASDLVAGAVNVGFPDNMGDSFDQIFPNASSVNVDASIASIAIGGIVVGTPAAFNSTDHFGFVARKIGSFKAGGITYTLNPAVATDNLAVGATGDVNVHEV